MSIFSNNFSGYYLHPIFPILSTKLLPEVKNIRVISKSREKFIALQINQRITFIDSNIFLSGSLDSMFETVQKSYSCNITKQSYLICDLLNKEKY